MPIEPEKVPEVVEVINWDPTVNRNVISIIKQGDGNWKGYMLKGEKLLEVRQVDPQYCLQALLTHN